MLALRVLEQAILDATSAPIPRGRVRSQCRPLDDERQDAVRFLTEPDGEWAAARAAWCDLAGVSPRMVIPMRGSPLRRPPLGGGYLHPSMHTPTA